MKNRSGIACINLLMIYLPKGHLLSGGKGRSG
jgi:hypothetical protein